ncbi:protein ABIL3-like isoform X2 [Hibiscus syriacus]|uniref:protein ABIL3-like isoform X2 n=1 Tax=Hibiscus syriacus TaxID=106335 RepID=UPI001924DC6C|nr:protein ABIL3-like isoform X2 [Hibiscus syriacus]
MTSAAAVPQESSHRDELLMQQSLLFSETLKDLKSLRKQLYSAAEYFEITYNKEAQKQIVEDTLKDYAIKALVNTVDHLGSVAYKVNDFLDDKMGEIFGTDLRLSCLEQRLQTYREFVNLGGLSQQSLVLEAVKHNKRYIFPVEQTPNDVAETRLKSQQFKNIGIQAIATETGSESIRDGFYELRSPQHLPRKSPKLFTSISMNQRQENRSTSPRRFPLPRSGSLMQRSSSPSHSNSRKRWPSEPRRTVSLSTSVAEREKVKDMEQYSSKSKRLFKAMLSLRKSKKDVTVYKYSDEN